jgi:large subunit ribosomal protein L25
MLELSAELRSETGRANKQVRKQGLIPAILYGQKVKNVALSIKEPDFEKLYQQAGESTLIKLKIGDEQDKAKQRIVLIHEVAKDPVSGKPIHIDFYQVKMDKVISVEVPLVFIGQSAAVEKEEGVLIKNIQQVEVEALPQDLPHEITVDISLLKTFEDNIYVKDLQIPDKVKLTASPDEVVASVIPPRTKAELEELEEAPAEKVEEVEVEEKGKAKEEVEEEAKEEPKKEAAEEEKEEAKEE